MHPSGSQVSDESPGLSQGHLFDVDGAPYLLLANGSRVYGLTEDAAAAIRRAMEARDDVTLNGLLVLYGLDAPPYVEAEPPEAFNLRAVSLAVAQKCNLGCTYCYAEGGNFGGPAKDMPLDVAFDGIRRVIDETPAGARANIAFLGGEPYPTGLLSMPLPSSPRGGGQKGVTLGFSITTNGTLVTPEDGEFFERHGFAVTVSLDGVGETHDAQRSFKGGRGSFNQIVERVVPLLAMQRRMQVTARVTVTPRNLRLRETLDGLIGLGFHGVGFSPMLSSPTGQDEMDELDLGNMLEQMIDCGVAFERKTVEGEHYPFTNIATALHEIHKGTHRPYPCGAGAGYMGVSAAGGLFACHRFVDDQSGAMGDVARGVDKQRQREWLAGRHVHFQEPCNGCWARYLCGGGCHHEVIHRGRPACDYIRGWLHYCLQAYVRLLAAQPNYFGEEAEPTRKTA